MKLSLDFAFEGFRIIRQRPMVILYWGILALIGNSITMYTFEALAGPALRQMQTMSATSPSTPAEVMAMLSVLGQTLPGYGVMIPIALVMNAVQSCAVFRYVLNDKPWSFGALHFGKDEFRQIGVSVLFFLIVIGMYIATIIAGTVVAGIVAGVLGLVSQALSAVALVISIVAVIAAFFWFVARLSLAPAQSFDQRRINMFGSWALTKNSSIALVVGYVIALVMALLVYMLCLLIYGAVFAVINGGSMDALKQLMQMVQGGTQYLGQPPMIVYMIVVNLLVSPLLMAITLGAPASAYRLLSRNRGGPAGVF